MKEQHQAEVQWVAWISREKTAVHEPQPPVSPVTLSKGWGVQWVVKIREVGTKKVKEK